MEKNIRVISDREGLEYLSGNERAKALRSFLNFGVAFYDETSQSIVPDGDDLDRYLQEYVSGHWRDIRRKLKNSALNARMCANDARVKARQMRIGDPGKMLESVLEILDEYITELDSSDVPIPVEE